MMTKFASVPDFARDPEIPASGYRVTELGGGAYGITSYLRACAAEALRMVDLRQAAVAAGVPDDNRQARLKVWMDAVVARAAELMPASWDKRLGGTTSSSPTTSTPSHGAFTTTNGAGNFFCRVLPRGSLLFQRPR